jgi:hypothetical protein
VLNSVKGKSINVKSDVYRQLNDGQKALFMFYAYHNHTLGVEEFYWFTNYYIYELRAWEAIKSVIRFFDDQKMHDLLERIEATFTLKLGSPEKQGNGFATTDLMHDASLFEAVNQLFSDYHVHAARTVQSMNLYVKSHLGEFIILDN